MSAYIELQAASNYSFLRGASHVEEMFAAAKALGYETLALTDYDTLGGMARAHGRAEEAGLRLVVGCRLTLQDAPPMLVYPMDRAGYAQLCRLLTLGKSRAGKDGCILFWADLEQAADGLLAILLPDMPDDRLAVELHRLHRTFPGRCYVQLCLRYRPGDAMRLDQLTTMAQAANVSTVVTGDVLYHVPSRRILQDVVTCIREGCTIDQLGVRRERFAGRHLRGPAEMTELYRRYPDALARTAEVAARCRFSLSELRYQYPNEAEPGEDPQHALERLVQDSVPDRYPDGLPPDVERQLRHEMVLIASLAYAPYFLTVHSIVRFARGRSILCQGRGSAANSAVCYVLGITAIDPVRSGLLFERFISAERHEPPDIDVDFESERREEVIQWVFEHYGRDRAALCCTVMRFRPRGAIRDVGKALGLPEDVTAGLASQVSGWSAEGVNEDHARTLNLNVENRRLRLALELANDLVGFPRQFGTHPGGFVLTADTLSNLVPVKPAAMVGRQVIEWDKDDIGTLKWMKVDVLGLGMLSCLHRAFELLKDEGGPQDIAAIPAEDPATYAMIRRADTVGTFQIESRAQMSMLPRLKPKTFYDLVVQVAIVRPGPIQGDMVHPYLRRREGREKPEYPKPELKAVLGKTLGVPLFQEQAMQVAIQCAGFTPGEADQLRRAMATFKSTGGVSPFRDKLIAGMVARGYEQAFAERTFSQLEGFGSYGFPESHAASFALVAYASSWVKCHHPAVFCCSLLNSQPMGFYAPAQLVRDARDHGVEVRPVCINASRWDSTLEADGTAVRLGLRLAKGLSSQDGAQLVEQRGTNGYLSIEDIWRRTDVPAATLERLAEADAFQSLGLARRAALWAVKGMVDAVLPLFQAVDRPGRMQPRQAEPVMTLPSMTMGREVVEDYRSTGLSLRPHPVTFLRAKLDETGVTRCADLNGSRDGRRVVVAGLVLVRQKPGSAKGVMFMTIEDETGVANLILWPDRFERQRSLVISASMVACHGWVQRTGTVVHVITGWLEDMSGLLRSLSDEEAVLTVRHGRGDAVTHPGLPKVSRAKGSRSTVLGTVPRDFR